MSGGRWWDRFDRFLLIIFGTPIVVVALLWLASFVR